MAPDDRVHKRKMEASEGMEDEEEVIGVTVKQQKVENGEVITGNDKLNSFDKDADTEGVEVEIEVEEGKKFKHRHRHKHSHRKFRHEKKSKGEESKEGKESKNKREVKGGSNLVDEDLEEGQVADDFKNGNAHSDPESGEIQNSEVGGTAVNNGGEKGSSRAKPESRNRKDKLEKNGDFLVPKEIQKLKGERDEKRKRESSTKEKEVQHQQSKDEEQPDGAKKDRRSRSPQHSKSRHTVHSPKDLEGDQKRRSRSRDIVRENERSHRARSRSRDSIRNRDYGRELDDYHKQRRGGSRNSSPDRDASPPRERRNERPVASPSREKRRDKSPVSSPLHEKYTSRHVGSPVRERRRDRSRGRSTSTERDRRGERQARSRSKERHRERLDLSPPRERRGDERDYSRTDRSRQKSRSDSRERRLRDTYKSRDNKDDRRSRKDDRYDRSLDDRDRRGNTDRRRDDRNQTDKSGEKSKEVREQENEEEYARRVASQLKAQEEEDEDPEKIKEQSRLRRQAILEKYKKQQQEKQAEALQPFAGLSDLNNNVDGTDAGVTREKPLEVPSPRFGTADLVPSIPTFAVDHSEIGTEAVEISNGKVSGADGLTASEAQEEAGIYDASVLRKTDEDFVKEDTSGADMFSDDIFAESPAGGRKMTRLDGTTLEVSGLTDNWDDAEGYYTFRINEILDNRYEVASSHGRGVFSTVVRAWDLKASAQEPDEVAIKIIRNNETMYKAGQQELVILNKLAGADPENRRHCVRLLSNFEYRGHLCLVFESLHMNLREILKKFGRNIGINLTAVRSYAMQLLISLKHLRNCGVLHCDIKPDNMLVNEGKNVLKLADFGSAMFAGENEITPYLVSRFYRAPEIMLGLPYDHALDMWSVGCCLYEMYTGKILFPGRTNNEMLRLHIELKGFFPKKLLKKAAFVDQHFDSEYNFCALEDDPVTKKTVKKIMANVQPKDMGGLLSGPGSAEEDPKMLAAFKDLLEKMFVLDPAKRINVSQAINHPFIANK